MWKFRAYRGKELDEYLAHMYDAIQKNDNMGTYFSTKTQTANAMALDLGIVPSSQTGDIVQALVEAVKNADTTIRTGVLGTKSMYDALSMANEHKTLPDMTVTPKKCSFGYMLDNGATTLWEYWDKVGETFNSHLTDDVGAYDSQNHTMMGGGLVTRMYNDLGGIAVSNWSVLDGAFSWEVTVPVNASAEIVIPAEVAEDLTESGRDVFEKDGDGLTYIGRNEDGDCVYAAGSGTYRFETAAGSSGIPQTGRAVPIAVAFATLLVAAALILRKKRTA